MAISKQVDVLVEFYLVVDGGDLKQMTFTDFAEEGVSPLIPIYKV